MELVNQRLEHLNFLIQFLRGLLHDFPGYLQMAVHVFQWRLNIMQSYIVVVVHFLSPVDGSVELQEIHHLL